MSYELKKLSFHTYYDELINLRIPPTTVFLLDRSVCYYILDPAAYAGQIFKYVPNNDQIKIAFDYIGRDYYSVIASKLAEASLVEHRPYYVDTFYEENKSLLFACPVTSNRRYRWSIGTEDYKYYKWLDSSKKFSNKKVTQPVKILMKAVHKYYLENGNKNNNLQNNDYYYDGKYFIYNDNIIYNDVPIGKLIRTYKNGSVQSVKIYNMWKNMFMEDFV